MKNSILSHIKLAGTIFFVSMLLTSAELSAQAEDSGNQKAGDLGGTVKSEDLHRFFGYEDPLAFRYLSLPYDAVMNTNVKEFTIEVGFLLLLLLPLALFLSPKIKPVFWISLAILLLLFLALSIGTTYCSQHGVSAENAPAHLQEVMAKQNFAEAPFDSIRSIYQWSLLQLFVPINQAVSSISSLPDTLTYPLLLGVFLFVLLLLHHCFQSSQIEKRSLILFTYFYGSLWLLLSAGLTWYGLLLFPMATMLTIYKWGSRVEGGLFPEKLQKGVLYGFAGIWLLMSISFRMANYDASNAEQASRLYYPPLAAYRNGELTAEQVTDMFRVGYPAVAKIINQETESLIYLAGTYLPYFIKKSDARCYADIYLEFFINLNQKYPQQTESNRAFRYMGFRYFIMDLNLPLVDKTPDKSLTRKVDKLMSYIYQNPEMELVATDRQIKLNSNGQVVNAVFLNEGPLVNAGTFAVFRLK